MDRDSQMPCPECHTSITVRLRDLIAGVPLRCPSCGLEVRVDLSATEQLKEQVSRMQEQAMRGKRSS